MEAATLRNALKQTDPRRAVPKPIVQKLTRAIRRIRALIVLRGLCATVATALGALLVVMAIDATITIFSATWRWLLSMAAYGAAIAVALWYLVRPLARSFTLAGIARAIELRHPELQEHISSAVELLTSDDAPELRGSDQLIAALVQQATANVQRIQPHREFTLRPARPFLIAAACVVGILVLLVAAWPDEALFLLKRASAPFINLPNLHARDLRVFPGDKVVAEGERVEIAVVVPNRAVRKATVHIMTADGREQAHPMLAVMADQEN